MANGSNESDSESSDAEGADDDDQEDEDDQPTRFEAGHSSGNGLKLSKDCILSKVFEFSIFSIRINYVLKSGIVTNNRIL